ncbi:MAG: hypothetical protein KDB14_12830 [Planctomycetales bacterium]|nr:hypothetical protein [Planctomycetales bacterium]
MMSFPPRQKVHTQVLPLLLIAQLATPCQAGLFDWLSPQPQTIVCCQAPTCSSCCQNRTIVNYAPETVYTTSWVRVPVTTYRPVATLDPTTCCRVNYMQPSTSYVWQARRTPHVLYRPFLSRVANACGCNGSCLTPGTGAAPGMIGPLVTAPSAPAIGTGVAPGTPTYPASPYPPSPYSAAPYGATPYGAMPASPTPAAVDPNAEPADLRPRLDPGAIPPGAIPQVNQRPTLSYPSSSAPLTTLPGYGYEQATPEYSYPTTPYVAPADSVGAGIGSGIVVPSGPGGATEVQRPSTESAAEPPRASTRPAQPPATNEADQNSTRNQSGPAPNPVPDPDANASPTPSAPAWSVPTFQPPNVPRLLNPSDRTASLRPRVVAPVHWATLRPATYRPAPTASTAPTSPTRQTRNAPGGVQGAIRAIPSRAATPLDDSGWQSVYRPRS